MLWAFRIWARYIHDQKVQEVQAVMDLKVNSMRKEEAGMTPFEHANAAFALSEHLRKKRDGVVSDIRKGVHHIHKTVTMTPKLAAVRYRRENPYENFEVDTAVSAVDSILQTAQENFMYSEQKRKERNEVQYAFEMELKILTERIAVMVQSVASLDAEGHSKLCCEVISTLNLSKEREGLVYREMLKVDDTNLNTLVKYGVYLFDVEGSRQGAINQFEKALSIDPKHVPTLIDYGCRLILMGEYAEAEKLLKNACEYDVDCVQALCEYAIYLYTIKGDMQLAEVKFREATLKDSNHERSLLYYASLLKDMKRFNQAGNCYSTILAHNPTHIIALNSYALILCQQSEYQKAEGMFESVLEIDGENISALINYAIMLHQTLPKLSSKVLVSPNITRKIIPKIRELLMRLDALNPPASTASKCRSMLDLVAEYEHRIAGLDPDCPIEKENNDFLSAIIDAIFPTKKKKHNTGDSGTRSSGASCFSCC